MAPTNFYSDYKEILNKDPSTLSTSKIFIALMKAVKVYHDYQAGKKLYVHLTKRLGIQDNNGNDVIISEPLSSSSSYSLRTPTTASEQQQQYQHHYIDEKIIYHLKSRIPVSDLNAFRDATTTLVRYAPHPRDALFFANFYMNHTEPPIRTEHTELCILNALIRAYSISKEQKYLECGIDLVEIGLERGLLLRMVDVNGNPLLLREGFEKSSKIFASVAREILKHHKLKPSENGASMVPLQY